MTNSKGYGPAQTFRPSSSAQTPAAQFPAGLDYMLSTNGSALRMQAAAPPIQNLCGAKLHHHCHPYESGLIHHLLW